MANTLRALALSAPAALAAVLTAQGLRTAGEEYLPAPAYAVDLIVGGLGATDPAGPRLAVLGDSTVEGIGATGPERTLPAQIAARVAERVQRPVEVVGLGSSGARTADVAWRQAALLTSRDVDAVVVVVGSNDATHALPPWRMRRLTLQMLEAVRAAAGEVPVVLGGIPEFHTVPAVPLPLRWVLGAHAAVLRWRQRAAAAQVRAPFVDIRALASPRFLARPASMSGDGFHPSELGYGYWADALAPAVVAVLASPVASGAGQHPGGPTRS